MKVITRQQKANTFHKRWADHIATDIDKDPLYKKIQTLLIQEVSKLDKNPNADDIDKIFVHNRWTHIRCGECHKYKPIVVNLFDDKYSCCFECLKKALKLLTGE